jgi:capsular polysaccharide transport system permease protein
MHPSSKRSLAHSFAIQCRVIGALLLRELITRYGRHNIGILWLVVEPMLFTLGITTLWNVVKLHSFTNISGVAFAITGYSSVLQWRNASNRVVNSILPNYALMYHRNVKVIDIFMSRIILEIVGATASASLLTIIFCWLGMMKWPDDVVLVLAGWGLLSWFTTALSLFIGALSERSELVERVWHVITYLLFPLSGAAFMVDWLPHTFQKVVLWFPTLHAVEMIRHGYFGNAVRTHEDPAYLALFSLCLTLFGLAMVRECGRRVIPE